MSVSDELWETLLRFHREVVMPDYKAVITDPLRGEMAEFRRETDAHFEAIIAKLDRMISAMEQRRR